MFMLLFHLLIDLHRTLALLLLKQTAEQPATPSLQFKDIGEAHSSLWWSSQWKQDYLLHQAESDKVRAQMHYHKVTCIGPWKPPKGAPAPKGRLALGFEAQTGTPQADFFACLQRRPEELLGMDAPQLHYQGAPC
eukprot:SM000029S10439  [mRNA]  locus=s29:117816:121115:+ [translate_table: standard]